MAVIRTAIVLLAIVACATAMILPDSEYTQAAMDDQIVNLPGITNVPFRQFAGYLNVDAKKNRNLFYWYVESRGNPATDPIALWSNGGPGCSGLIGFMTEHGPFAPQKDGTLLLNDFAWNKVAGMMYIEAPAGVGFSYSDDKSDYNMVGDARTASDNYKAILAFLAKFPQLKNNSFFISSESYGGHYMPTLAMAIVDGNAAGVNPKINFKGFAVGNPYTDPDSNGIYGEFPTYWGHQLVSAPTWQQFVQHCYTKPDSQCDTLQYQIRAEVGNVDPYALDAPICIEVSEARRLRNYTDMARGLNKLGQPYPYQPCQGDYATTYLNRKDVIAAIHAKPDLGHSWVDCSNIVHYNMTELDVPMEPLYIQLLQKQPDIRILVYSGDNDAVCATEGTQYWIYKLGLQVTKKWSPWTFKGQVAGYSVHFKGITFVTVHSAGHMVPALQPERALTLWTSYLNNKMP